MIGDRPFSAEEMRDILALVKSPRDYALIEMQRWTGLRISEVLSLTMGDVARNWNAVNDIVLAWQSKVNKARQVRLADELKRALKRYLNWLAGRGVAFSKSRPLFFSPRFPRRPLTTRAAYDIIFQAATRAGVHGKIGTHSLRKTAAEALYQASGFDIQQVQAFLGHKNVGSTGHYVGYQSERKAWDIILELGSRADDGDDPPSLWDKKKALN